MVTAFFDKFNPGVWMPKTGGAPSALGIQYQGKVLNGELSVQQAFALAEIDAARYTNPQWWRRGDTGYCRMEDYDPVLRYHLGMQK